MLNITTIIISFLISFYSLSYTDSNGASHSMSSYAGKKMLIVNIATNSPRAAQIGQLQQLRQQFGDSVVIIAFPSDQFNNEPHTNQEIRQICQSQYNAGFIITEKTALNGSSANAVYNWLTQVSHNGAFSQPVSTDFEKFIIDKEGNLLGAFAAGVSPMDTKIINALTNN